MNLWPIIIEPIIIVTMDGTGYIPELDRAHIIIRHCTDTNSSYDSLIENCKEMNKHRPNNHIDYAYVYAVTLIKSGFRTPSTKKYM